MRRSVVGLVFVAASVTSAADVGPASGSCLAGVSLTGTFYTSTRTVRAPRDGGAVHGGVLPSCDDVIVQGPDGQRQNPRAPDTPIALRRIKGVSARVALLRPGQSRTVFLAPGYFAVAGHPLFALLPRNASAPSSCGPEITVRDQVPFQPGYGRRFVLGSATAGKDVRVTPSTKFRGPTRHGLPYIDQGMTVSANGRRCTVDQQQVLVARTLTIVR